MGRSTRNQTLTGRSPNAPSPSVSATSPLTSSGPTSETSSFPCKALRPAERPREASAVGWHACQPNRSLRPRMLPPGQKDTGLITRCAVARIRDVSPTLLGPQSKMSYEKRSPPRGGILAHRTVRSVRGCPSVDVHPVKRPTGWSPDAPSQSNVDGTVAQCAVAISIRDVAIDVDGTHLRDVVVPLRCYGRTEKPREVSETRGTSIDAGTAGAAYVQGPCRGWPPRPLPFPRL